MLGVVARKQTNGRNCASVCSALSRFFSHFTRSTLVQERILSIIYINMSSKENQNCGRILRSSRHLGGVNR